MLNRMTFGADLIQTRSVFERQLTVNSVNFNELLRPFELCKKTKRTISTSHCFFDLLTPRDSTVRPNSELSQTLYHTNSVPLSFVLQYYYHSEYPSTYHCSYY